MPTADPGRRARWLSRAADGVLIAALIGLGLLFWPRFNGASDHTPFDTLPWWATIHDQVLQGPDAGEWAANAFKVRQGRFDELDMHRMPTWLLLTGAMLVLQPDVALAGHLVNHLLFLGLPLLVYGLARLGHGPRRRRRKGARRAGGVAGWLADLAADPAWPGRAVGFGAGAMVAACPPLVEASRAYGVDPAVQFFLVASLLAALTTRIRWWLAAPAGALAAVAASTHFTALPFVGPAVIVVLLRGPSGWRRFAATGLHAGSAALVLWLIFATFPFPPARVLFHAVSEGVAPASVDISSPEYTLSDSALDVLDEGRDTAVDDALIHVVTALRPGWLPWYLALALPWIGALGLGVPPWRPRRRGRRRRGKPGARQWIGAGWRLLDLGLGIPLLLCLAPLPVFAAADAPVRYGNNLLPFAALLMVRGLVGLAALADRGIRLAWPRWVVGVLAGATAAAVAIGAWTAAAPRRNILPPLDEGIPFRQLGELLAEHFPPGGGASCSLRESAAHAGRAYCPQTACPYAATEPAYRHCLGVLVDECGGEGAIPYVVVRGHPRVLESHAKQAMDDWAMERWGVVGTAETGLFTAHVVAIPREDAEGLAVRVRGPAPGTMGGPAVPPPATAPPPGEAPPPGAQLPAGSPGRP